jgi:cold shock CspA family protein
MEGRTNQTPANVALLLAENDLWMKTLIEGPHSLCRAISASLFFTERFHSEVQNQLVNFFRHNSHQINFKFMRQFSVRQLLEHFVVSPGRPEYESVNLELAAHVFSCRFKLYYSLGHRFCSESFQKKQKKVVRIFKRGSSGYAAVFKKETQETALVCQQIVLGLVKKMFDAEANVFTGETNASFINFDLIYFKNEAGESSKRSEPANFSRMPQATSDVAGEERQFWAREPGDNTSVGEDLLQMIKSRKCKSLKQQEQNQQNFLKSFVDPLTFFDTLQLRCPDPVGPNDSGSEESFEEYVRKYQAEHDKLNVDVDLDRLSLDFTYTRPIIGTVSTRSDDFALNTELLQHKIAHESELHRPGEVVVDSGSLANIDALDWTTPESPHHRGTTKNSLKLKLKHRQNLPKEFVPNVTGTTSDAQLSSFRQSKPELAEFGSRYAPPTPYPTSTAPPGPKNQFSSSTKGLSGFDCGSKDRYIEMIDPILYEGRLKFFDEKNGFGFLLVKENGVVQDLFVYKSEFERAKVPMESLRQVKSGLSLYFSFQIARYTARGQSSKKAINIRMIRRCE